MSSPSTTPEPLGAPAAAVGATIPAQSGPSSGSVARNPQRDAPRVIRPRFGTELTYGEASELIANVLHGWSGFVVVPSCTGYALAALPTDERAIGRLDAALDHAHEPIPLVVSSVGVAEKWIEMNGYDRRVLSDMWPGAVTLVAPARGHHARHVSQLLHAPDSTLGVRMSRSVIERGLSAEAGIPLTTAAIRDSRGDIVRDYAEAIDIVWDRIGSQRSLAGAPWAAIRTDATFPHERHSTVARVHDDGRVTILRDGAVPKAEIAALVHRVALSEYGGDAT